jgi:hypothetical protein
VELIHFGAVHIQDNDRTTADPAQASGAASHSISLPQFFATDRPLGCPYQVAGMCTAREARPLGCRVYFCDENAQGWQNALYERYHAKLRDVHARFDVPYEYIEWRAALRRLMDETSLRHAGDGADGADGSGPDNGPR